MKSLIQEVLGYICSHYNNAKAAIMLSGEANTGKSVLCKIISLIIGEKNVKNVDMAKLSSPVYAAELNGILVNISPDLPNDPIKDAGYFKSLTSHNDTIMACSKYKNPIKIKCETKMVFATNHPVEIDSKVFPEDIEAIFNRLIYIPYQNKSIPKSDEKRDLSEKLENEIDGIFTYAMAGLRRYLLNNNIFSHSKLSEMAKNKDKSRYCPEKVFAEEYLRFMDRDEFDDATKYPEFMESTKKIDNAFEAFCNDRGIMGSHNIRKYIVKTLKYKIVRYRLYSEDPIHCYNGIRIKSNYSEKQDE